MLILGIETSCDETAAAVVKNGNNVLSSVIASSEEIHMKTGGIIPENAARQQIISIVPVIEEALKKADVSPEELDAIAVTYGPGLIGSLLVGIEFAKVLSYLWKKPLIPVNHLVGHIYANFIDNTPTFPSIALVVSGGHTDLVLMKQHGKVKWIGGTRDDAAGEAFDKTARLLSLPYPGGPAISKSAENHLSLSTNNQPLNLFPRPLINSKDYDFSFSGLKTSVMRNVQGSPISSKQQKNKLAAEVQEAIAEVLVKKTLNAVEEYNVQSLLLAGGVAANSRLRNKFKSEIKAKKLQAIFHVPPTKYCTDNAAYIATSAFYNSKAVKWDKVSANPQLAITN